MRFVCISVRFLYVVLLFFVYIRLVKIIHEPGENGANIVFSLPFKNIYEGKANILYEAHVRCLLSTFGVDNPTVRFPYLNSSFRKSHILRRKTSLNHCFFHIVTNYVHLGKYGKETKGEV